MKMYELEIYVMDGEIYLTQDDGDTRIVLSFEQAVLVCGLIERAASEIRNSPDGQIHLKLK